QDAPSTEAELAAEGATAILGAMATGDALPAKPDTAAPPPEAGGPFGLDLGSIAGASMKLYGEWARIILGLGEREVPAKDARFADPAWREHPLYRRLGQGYLAFCEAV